MSGETGQVESGWTTDTLREHMTELVAAHRREVAESLAALATLHEALRKSDKEAVDKAFAAASELSKAHNDLLRKMESLSETFATKESVDSALDSVVDGRREQRAAEEKAANARFGRLENWQARMTGALIAVGASTIANFVKLWTE